MNKLNAALMVLLFLTCPIFSAGTLDSLNNDLIVVTKNRTLAPIAMWGTQVQIIDVTDETRRGATGIGEVVNNHTGINAVDTSHQGSLFMRGLPSRFTKVLINGIDTKDPISPNAASFWDGLSLGIVDRLEVIDGSQGAVLGQSAVAGAINAVVDTNGLKASTIIGTDYSQSVLKYGKRFNDFKWVAAISRELDSRLSAKVATFSPDIDPYDTENRFVSVQWNTPDIVWNADYLSTDATVFLDGYNSDSPTNQLTTRTIRTGSRFEWKWSDTIRQNLTYTYSKINRDDTSSGTYFGDGHHLESAITKSFESGNIVFGISHDIDNGFQNGTYETINYSSQFATDIYTAFSMTSDSVKWNVAGRQLFNSTTTAATVGSTGLSVTFGDRWQWDSSIGTGFKCPSIYEVAHTSSLLTPERSWSVDTRIIKELWPGFSTYTALYYSEIMDKIDYTYPAYMNVTGISIAKGVEVGVSMDQWGRLTYNRTVSDSSIGTRVPEFKWIGSLHIPFDGVSVDIYFQSVGRRKDSNYSTVMLSEYALTDAAISYPIGIHWAGFIRINNVFKTAYESASGYSTLGQSVLAGITYQI